jgi:hypothetical protein
MDLAFDAAVVRLQTNQNKYAIIPKYIDLSNFDVLKFMNDTEKMKPSLETVFQSFDKNHISDRKRKQISGDTRKCLIPIQQSIANLMITAFPDVELTYPKATTLISFAGCEKQAYHYDFNTDHPNCVHSYACLVALMDHTQIYGLIECNDDPHNVTFKEATLKLHAGDVLVFRGDFIHAGSDYADRNVRVHFYFENKNRLPELGDLRATNTTYKVAAETDEFDPLQHISGSVNAALTRCNELFIFEQILSQRKLEFCLAKQPTATTEDKVDPIGFSFGPLMEFRSIPTLSIAGHTIPTLSVFGHP